MSARYPTPTPLPSRKPGRPRRLRWPQIDPAFHKPSKLTGTDALAYRLATSEGEDKSPAV